MQSIYDWLVRCCPMMDMYGCDFKIPRLANSVPTTLISFKLVHNNCSGMQFAVTFKEESVPLQLDTESSESAPMNGLRKSLLCA